MATEPLKLGLLGAGAAMRRLHLPALAVLRDEIRVVDVWSRSADNARAIAQQHGIERWCADYRELLSDRDVDAVLIAVPIERNASLLMEAVEAGKHVLAEKPIAATVPEARRVLEAVGRSDRVVAIAENFRYREDVRRARSLIEAGAIGAVQCFQANMVFDLHKEFRRDFVGKPWRQNPAHPGGLLVDAGVHSAAALNEILGEIRDVYAHTLHRPGETTGPTGLLMQMTLAAGAPGHYLSCHTARTDRETVFDLTVYGDRGTLWLTEGAIEWTEGADNQRKTHRHEGHDRGYQSQLRNFRNAVLGKEEIYSTPEKATGDLLFLHAALHSAQTGQRVDLAKFAATS